MLIRRNSKIFKLLKASIEKYARSQLKKRFIKLFYVKAGKGLEEKVPIESLKENKDFIYELNLKSLLSNLTDPNHTLHQSDTHPGLFYFLSGSDKNWTQTPFALKGKLKEDILIN